MIPELIKKKEARNVTLKQKRDEERKKAKDQRKLKLKEYISRGEKWYKADTQAKKDLIKMKRDAKRAGNYYVPSEAKVAFVVRIKGYYFVGLTKKL